MASYKRIPIDKLKVDDRYQRQVDPRWVNRLANKFDEAMIGTLEVSQRGESGSYTVFDGQHRLEAAKSLGMASLPCLVHKGLTPEEEAELFVALQRKRKSITSVERFKARVFYGDATAIEVQEIMDASPFRIADASSRDAGLARTIKSVTTLERICGRGILPETLALLDTLWGGDDRSTDSGLIEGLSLLIESYGTRLDDAALQKLRAVPPIDIVRRSMGRMSYASSKSADRRLAVFAELRKISGVRGRPSARTPVETDES